MLQANSNFVLMIAAEDRILRHVIHGVMRPTRIPLEAETEAAAAHTQSVQVKFVKQIVRGQLIFRNVPGRPIENDTDSALMEIVHQEHEVRGRSKLTGGHGKEFDMREAGVMNVAGKLHGHLPVRERAVSLFRHSLPGSEVDFVNGNRRVRRVLPCPVRHPLAVRPGINP